MDALAELVNALTTAGRPTGPTQQVQAILRTATQRLLPDAGALQGDPSRTA